MSNKRRVAITIDVDAQPARTPENQVDHLIWGRVNGREAGLGKMMDIADRHNVKLTCFVDILERELWGDAIS